MYCKSSSISYPPSQSWKELEQLTCFFIGWFINDLCILHTGSHHSGSNMLMDVRQSELPGDLATLATLATLVTDPTQTFSFCYNKIPSLYWT